METKIKDINTGDLYALLSLCTNEDLDPLVRYITSNPLNQLDTNADYKQYSPDHTQYYRAIVDAICLSGRTRIRNLMRSEELPVYDDVLLSVCKKLDVPHTKGDTVGNESNLITIFLEGQWKTLSEEERVRLTAEASANAARGLNDRTKPAAVLGTTLSAAKVIPHPVVKGGLAAIGLVGSIYLSIKDPDFTVAVPCVLHIAYLRRKYLEILQSTRTAEACSEKVPTVSPRNRANTLVVENSEQVPVLSMVRISDPSVENWKPVHNDDGISRLNSLLQGVPSLVTASDVATSQYMEVVINGPLLKAKGKEGYRLITMIDKKPQHGTLLDPSQLSTIVNAAALFQVASVAVAQKHLADISRKLSEIKAIVERIDRSQKDQRLASIRGAIQYFEQVAHAVLSGELSDSVSNQIEHLETQLLQIQEHLLLEIRNQIPATMEVKDEAMFGSQAMENSIRAHQERLDDLYQQLLLCIRARACGWQLLSAYPGSDLRKDTRKRNIEEALDLLNEGGELLSKTDEIMRQKVKSMFAHLNRKITVNQRKLALLQSLDQLLAKVSQNKQKITEELRTAQAFIASQSEPATILVKIENGQIVASRPA